ncbi:hypothetical protein [Salibaculum griseiflavum]|nr:hypothetical protein [Salibaculum griseiflavum]
MSLLKPGQPGIRFCVRDMQASQLKLFPCRERRIPHGFALFLALQKL